MSSPTGAAPANGVLLIDGDCTFCRFAAERLRDLGVWCAIEPQSPELLRGLAVDAERARREVPFVDADGRVWWGDQAIARACATGGTPARAAARVLGIGVLAPVWARAYRGVAEHRSQLMRVVAPFWTERGAGRQPASAAGVHDRHDC